MITRPNAYRFELKIAADSTQKFGVVEERGYDTTTAVTNMGNDAIRVTSLQV